MLKLFHVEGTATGYDTYSDFVCAAEDIEEARRIHPSSWREVAWSDEHHGWLEGSDPLFDSSWDLSIETVTVTEIGVASENVKVGIICSSFHAG